MERVPIMLRGEQAGIIEIEEEGLYLRLSVRCTAPGTSLWCAWIVGTRGKVRLGILEPHGKEMRICRRISRRELASVGRIMRGELHPGGEQADREPWEPWRAELSDMLHLGKEQLKGAVYYRENTLYHLAIPYERNAPFPLAHLFCFATIRPVLGKLCVLYCLDESGWPQFPQIS